MKNLLTTLVFMLVAFAANAQDMIYKNDGTPISAKVLEISDTEVRFKKTENLDGPTYVESTKNLLMLRPEKGPPIVFKKDAQASALAPNPTIAAASTPASTPQIMQQPTVVQQQPTVVQQQPTVVYQQPRTEPTPTYIVVNSPPNGATSTSNADNMCDKGIQDSRVNYKAQGGGGGWISATTILLSPVAGAITAGLIASSPPQMSNLNAPSQSLLTNPQYASCYQGEAHKIKKKAAWSAFGLGTLTWGLLLLLLPKS